MDIDFERGNRDKPKGHALMYFRNSSDPEDIWATYLVIWPIKVDISKYVPPFLMNQVGELGPKDFSAFAFPPAPEQVQSYGFLEELASLRDDDIIFGGTLNPTDVASGMMSVNEAVQRYADMYTAIASQHEPDEISEEGSANVGVNEVLYGLMSDGDKLNELTRLIGRLRFAMEGADEGMVKEAEEDITLLAKHMPENNKISRLVETTKAQGNLNTRLAELYLKRCFHLVQEEYIKLGELESEIRTLESGSEGIPT